MADEKTAEQKEAEAKMEKLREVALKNLDSSLWNYAAPKIVTSKQFGQLADAADAIYGKTISQAPDQNIYEQIFLPQLQGEGGAITNSYVQQKTYQTIIESFDSIKVEDAMKYVGAKGEVKKDLKGKYIGMFKDKEGNNPFTPFLMAYGANNLVSNIVGESKKAVTSQLENMLTEPKEEAPKK